LFECATAKHELHYIDVSDELCKAQLKERSRHLAEGAAWTTDTEFDAITKFFQPQTANEGFNVIRHDGAQGAEELSTRRVCLARTACSESRSRLASQWSQIEARIRAFANECRAEGDPRCQGALTGARVARPAAERGRSPRGRLGAQTGTVIE
jgi:hypothetical protein